MLTKLSMLALFVVTITGCSSAGVTSTPSSPANSQMRERAVSSTLYVANRRGNSLAVFTEAGQLIRKVTSGIASPSSVSTDNSGRVYVANYGPQRADTDIAIFDRRANKLISTITSHVAKPKQIVLDGSGTLYASMSRWVQVYPDASSSRTYRIFPGGGPIAVDSDDDLYVAQIGHVAVYAAHIKHKPRMIDVTGTITTLAVDAAGDLFAGVTNVTSGPCRSAVYVYEASSGKLLRTITQDICVPSAIVFDSQQNAYVANVESEGSFRTSVAEFAAGTTSVMNLITDGVSDPISIAVSADGTLFVANNLQSTIAIYASGAKTPKTVIEKSISGPSALAIGL
jgi:6-phosphogluconolactonase (cycloisomerase 2 family)